MVVSEKDTKQLLDFWESTDFNLWDLQSTLADKVNFEIYVAVLGKPQAELLKYLLGKMLWTLDEWHDREDTDSHHDIREAMKSLEAKFRNHRHETGKTFSAKPEY